LDMSKPSQTVKKICNSEVSDGISIYSHVIIIAICISFIQMLEYQYIPYLKKICLLR
jgi:hypothetical protein